MRNFRGQGRSSMPLLSPVYILYPLLLLFVVLFSYFNIEQLDIDYIIIIL